MRLMSWNVNGIRACWNKGFPTWFETMAPDVVCIQETKARVDQLSEEMLRPFGYHSYWHSAEKAGYSGVATFSKKEIQDVQYGLGVEDIDREGRVIITDHGSFVLVNCYFPNSQREGARLDYKLHFCEKLGKFLKFKVSEGRHIVLCGDLNIAHEEIDLRNPKSNTKNAGFLPEERQWMTSFLNDGFVDVFRHAVKEPHNYTWWSYRPGVREKNIGWRIDYHVVNEAFLDQVKWVGHMPKVLGSDHCPVVLDLFDA